MDTIKKIREYVASCLKSDLMNQNGRVYAEEAIKNCLESLPLESDFKVGVDKAKSDDQTVYVKIEGVKPLNQTVVSVGGRSIMNGIGEELTDQIMEQILEENNIKWHKQDNWYVIDDVEYNFGSYAPRTISIFRHSDHHEPDFDLTKPDSIQKMIDFINGNTDT